MMDSVFFEYFLKNKSENKEIKRIIQNILSEDVSDFTINSKCSQCGECCNDYLFATKEELLNIKKYIGQNNIEPEEKVFYDDDTDELNIHILCPFLKMDSKECLVYPVRPEICKKFKCSKSIKELTENQYNFITSKNHIPVSMHNVFLKDSFFNEAIERTKYNNIFVDITL